MVNNIFDEFRISKGIARWTDEFVCQLPYDAYGVMEEVPDVKIAGQYNTVSLATMNDVASAIATPIGTVTAYGGTSAPTGWLLCEGQTVSRTTYSNLYAITGDTHGAGDGSTTFNVPDYNSSGFAGPQVYIIKR
jgi:hypothetical protein